MMNAKDLPCLFESLANEYDESQLVKCETKESQRWRHASASAAAERITEIKKSFTKRVTKTNDSTFLDSEKKQRTSLLIETTVTHIQLNY